jgi:hypothetical protein
MENVNVLLDTLPKVICVWIQMDVILTNLMRMVPVLIALLHVELAMAQVIKTV